MSEAVPPIVRMMNDVVLEPYAGEVPQDGGLYATHHGVFRIAGFQFRCYQLSDGQRVLDADDVKAFFAIGALEPGGEIDKSIAQNKATWFSKSKGGAS